MKNPNYKITKSLTEDCDPCTSCGATRRHIHTKKCTHCTNVNKAAYNPNNKFTQRRREIEYQKELKQLTRGW